MLTHASIKTKNLKLASLAIGVVLLAVATCTAHQKTEEKKSNKIALDFFAKSVALAKPLTTKVKQSVKSFGSFSFFNSSINQGKLKPISTFGDQRFRHADTITKIIAFKNSPRLLSSSRDGTVRLWDAATGKLLKMFRHEKDDIWNVALFNDEKEFVSCGDKFIDHWDIASGKKLKTIKPAGTVHRVKFVSGSSQFVTAGPGSKSQLWDLHTEKKIRTYKRHKEDVYGVDVSHDGKWLVTSGDDDKICLFELESGKFIGDLGEHKSDVYTVEFSPDSKQISSCDSKGNVTCFVTATQKRKWTRKLPSDTTIVKWSKDGETIGCTCDDGNLYVLDAKNGKSKQKIKTSGSGSWSIDFANNPNEIFSGNNSQVQHFAIAESACLFPNLHWDTVDGKAVQKNNVAQGGTKGYAQLNKDDFVFIATDPTFRIYSSKTLRPRLVEIKSWQEDWGEIAHADFLPDQNLAVITTSEKVVLCDFWTGQILNTFPEKSKNEINGSFVEAQFVGNKKRVLVGTGEQLKFLSFDGSVTTSTFASFDYSTEQYVSVPLNRQFFVLRQEDSDSVDFHDNRGQLIRRLELPAPTVMVSNSRNGQFLSVVDGGDQIIVYGPNTSPFENAPELQQIDKWIDDLASNHYSIRAAAEKKLMRCGKAAIQRIDQKITGDIESRFRFERLRKAFANSFVPAKRLASIAMQTSPQHVALSNDGKYWAAVLGEYELTRIVIGTIQDGEMKTIGEADDLHSPQWIRFCDDSKRILASNYDGTISLYEIDD